MNGERAIVTCACGASITVRALTVEEARWLTEAFLAAHTACREAFNFRMVTT
ncbi:MAG TPA: hypothetical protein VGW38_24255 [Chloroflexota bacterium]|nr:hypothetical protein [Chloroflexota bacterium]